MAHIKKVESNIKGGVDVDLGSLTLVVGPSGSAKTALWNTIELPYLEGCSDVGIYDWRGRDRDLIDELAPPDAHKLWAKLTADTGEVTTAEIERNKKTGGAKKATYKRGFSCDLPVHPFRAGLRGKPESIRSFLLQRMTAKITDKDVIKRVGPDSADAYQTVLDAVRGADDSAIDLLLAVRAEANSRASVAKKQGTQVENAIKEWSKNLGPEPTDADIEAAKKDVTAKTTALQVAQKTSTAAAPPVNIDALYADAYEKVQAFQAIEQAVSELEALLPPETSQDTQTRDLRRALIVVWNAHLQGGDPTSCGVCGSEFSLPAMAANWMRSNRDGFLTDAQMDANRAHNQQKLLRLTADLKAAEKAAGTAVGIYEQAKSMQATTPPPGPGVDIDELLADVTMASTLQNNLEHLRDQWQQIKDKKCEMKDHTEAHAQWSELVEACDDATESLMDSIRESYVMAVNEHLPTGDTFDLILSEDRGGKEVPCCKFGLVRGEHLFTALSGAELGRVVAAMVAATLTGESESDVVIVTLPKDVGMDRQALRATMAALTPLAKQGVQVILFSVIGHAGKKPAQWTVVNLDTDGNAKLTGKATGKVTEGLTQPIPADTPVENGAATSTV